MTSPSSRFDVAVIGGGIVGSAVAYFLLRESPAAPVHGRYRSLDLTRPGDERVEEGTSYAEQGIL